MEYPHREILKIIGESTAYSAKGHFKSADVRRILTFIFIFINIVFAALAMTDLMPPFWLKILSFNSLAVSILLLTYEVKGGLGICDKHMLFGNLYLELHNDIMIAFINDYSGNETIEQLKNRVNELNKKERPHITTFAKWWAKNAIEGRKEIKNWWKM
jgi:hypothetical protein